MNTEDAVQIYMEAKYCERSLSMDIEIKNKKLLDILCLIKNLPSNIFLENFVAGGIIQ